MAKRKETIEIESAFHNICIEKRIYGCEEVTIGFHNNGHGNEVVDYMTMDSKGIITCYEIKVTLQDLKSKAKKSWYGHKNYLVVSADLYDKINDWSEYLPANVGLIQFGFNRSIYSKNLRIVFNSKRQNISIEDNIMLKESLIRSMYYKMQKYKDSKSIEKQKELEAEIRKQKKDRDHYFQQWREASQVINDYENYKYLNEGVDIDLREMAKAEREKYYKEKRIREV